MRAPGLNSRREAALAYAAYNFALACAGLALLPALPWLFARFPGTDLAQRMGGLAAEVRALCGRRPLWVHAASVGEVLAAQPLIALLRQQMPQIPVMITTTSTTGRAAARAQLGVPATLLPADLEWVVRRAVRSLRPRALVILETEIWPNLLRAAGDAGVPVFLLSARVSGRAASQYAWIRPLTRAALAHVRQVGAQGEADAERLRQLGVAADRVQVTGSLKFARQQPTMSTAPPLLEGLDRPLLVAASTQPGEEEVVLEACTAVWSREPRALLVLAPRRPERFDAVAQMLAAAGVHFLRRTQGLEHLGDDVRVLLLDTVGELIRVLPGARAAFVGGTLAPLGGHNVLEPALFGIPVCFGPHLDNVRLAADVLLEAGAAVQVADAASLARFWGDLVCDPREAERLGRRGREAVARGAEAAQRAVELMRPVLEEA